MGGLKLPPRRAWTLNTGQTTVYHAGDDADILGGILKPTASYVASGSGTTNVDHPHYAAATISFTAATKVVADSANGLATFLNGDTIRVRGGLNDGKVLTIASGGSTAGSFTVTEAITQESAGSYVTLCKRAVWSNVVVQDMNTGLMWLQKSTSNGGSVFKIGAASDGRPVGYDATKCYVIHAAGADLQMIASTHILKIVGGAAEVGKFWAGMCIVCAGFANAGNNLPGRWVTAVTVNGSDLDLTLYSWGIASGVAARNLLFDEAAGGSRSISVECLSGYALAAAANAASLGGYTNWRIPSVNELYSLVDGEAPTAAPDATAFPSWNATVVHLSSTTDPTTTTNMMVVIFSSGESSPAAKTGKGFLALVRSSF